MAVKTVKGSKELGEQIKARRNELGYTIEKAASLAGVGVKTWCRYEAGESIRVDKVAAIHKVLRWNEIFDELDDQFDIEEYTSDPAWPKTLVDECGLGAGISFVIGKNLLKDYINQDLEELKRMPKGSHVGQLELSFLSYLLPEQFMMNYDYEFLYAMECALKRFVAQAKAGTSLRAHSVIEELVLYLVMETSHILMDERVVPNLSEEDVGDWTDWPFVVFDDSDIETFLYGPFYLTKDHPYHFDHWTENVFYMDR